MFLSIDAGNSNIVFGFYDPETEKWTHEYRLETRRDLTLSYLEKNIRFYFLENGLRAPSVKAVGISSVVPEISDLLVQFSETFFHKTPHLINERSYTKLKISTARPQEMGTDLMANAAAAYEYFQTTCVIIDFGTALTFTVIDKDGKIMGVNIVPGLKTALKSLFRNTSKLPEVKLEVPQSAIGKDTIHSIQAGILFGYTGLVKGMLEAIKKEVNLEIKTIATGGLSEILSTLKGEFDKVDRELTLKGIKLITEKNMAT
ncbi:type III pantothenate kinase [Echinicola marina]|uniref:type III pantothenate kinase n=1 Tax=Echinicola marina TaxID=2859768 RepID=UPI001CF6501B|nr:type III pantothenate kinase [Echinicola marina]UCS94414.1 type III pantothenate kinase [Echinicola marina]